MTPLKAINEMHYQDVAKNVSMEICTMFTELRVIQYDECVDRKHRCSRNDEAGSTFDGQQAPSCRQLPSGVGVSRYHAWRWELACWYAMSRTQHSIPCLRSERSYSILTNQQVYLFICLS